MILYSNLGTEKQLNEIIFAGAHDAGINAGGGSAKTQTFDIFLQAASGVRFFDVRVSGHVDSEGGVTHQTFHGKNLNILGLKKKVEGEKFSYHKLAGAWGMELEKICNDAREFVTAFPSEFLILKFDKSKNAPSIAQACRDLLGPNLYTGGGNVNTKTLGELGGKVIVAFMPDNFAELKLGQGLGITPIKNLYKPPSGYEIGYPGLQYWGAGGTKWWNGKTDKGKMKENVKTQSKIMNKASTGIYAKCPPADPNAIGMMYWTSTGAFRSVEKRNKRMWRDHSGMGDLWLSSFQDYIDNAMPDNINKCSFSAGGALKMFMPNIVMIDFADALKCEQIYGLNALSGNMLVDIYSKLIERDIAGI